MSVEYPKLHKDVRLHLLDSKASEPVYLLEAPDGRQWQIPAPFQRFLSLLDGTKSLAELQRELDAGDYPGLSGCDVADIFEKFVLSCRLLSFPHDSADSERQTAGRRSTNLTLALPLIHSSRLRFLTRVTQHAFTGRRALACLLLLLGAALQVISWQALRAEWGGGVRPVYGPWQIALLVAIALACLPIHELGHLSACHRFGCQAGNVGIGTYLVFPVMYAELSAAWSLPRAARVVIDAGGVYFQFLAATALAIIHLLTRDLTVGFLAFGYFLAATVNINPLLKLDGYWCLGDWLGISNLHGEARRALAAVMRKALGWPASDAAFTYHGWRRGFLIIFGAAHVLFMGLICWTVIFLLPSTLWWFNHQYLIAFVNQITDSPFTQKWWSTVPRRVPHLLLSVGVWATVIKMVGKGLMRLIVAPLRGRLPLHGHSAERRPSAPQEDGWRVNPPIGEYSESVRTQP